MKLQSKSYKKLTDLLSAITDELLDRLQREPKNHADEFVAIKDLELSVGTLTTSLVCSGKIKVKSSIKENKNE